MRMTRSSGVLLHPTSLPSPFGIGDFGPSARAFVDTLSEAGQRLWQVLPLGPTGYGDSPYAPFSTFAGNELLISPLLLANEGLLRAEELAPGRAFPEDRVDYGAVIPWKRALLETAASRFLKGADSKRLAAFAAFKAREKPWLEDYALFMAIKVEYDGKAAREGASSSLWSEYWPRSLALRESGALTAERLARADAIERIEVLQFFFFEQWADLKRYANDLGVSIIGDIPIFVARDSSDVWTRPELFLLDSEGRPTEVAGVPPDYFSADGQLWGNPLYDWDAHRREGFAWWISRISCALSRYDCVRVDHFRGFDAFWAVPAGDKTARNGVWRPAPGQEVFSAISAALGAEIPIIAEDLGFITDGVRKLRDDLGLPGMRILQFAFDATESGTAFDPDNGFLPHNYVEHCLAYTGTHDNDTLVGWLEHATPAEREYVETYLGYAPSDPAWALLREAWKSVAAWAIAPMQDILGLGSEARMNTPSTVGGNWSWRLGKDEFSPSVAARLKGLTQLYGRGAK
jgi:4-alpha-glucanotransferase